MIVFVGLHEGNNPRARVRACAGEHARPFPVLTKGEKQPGRVCQRGTLLQNILDEAKVVFIRCINIHDEW